MTNYIAPIDDMMFLYENLRNNFKNQDFLLIDLREESEILKKPSLNNSINIPYSNLQDYINNNKK